MFARFALVACVLFSASSSLYASAAASAPASVVSKTSPPPKWPPTPAPTRCDPSYEYLLIPVAGVCDAYTVCYSGRSQRMPCPAPLQFHYKLQTCDWPQVVQCVPCPCCANAPRNGWPRQELTRNEP